MRKLLLLIGFIPILAIAQNFADSTIDNNIKNYTRIQAGASVQSWHRYLTPFVGFKFSDAHMNFMSFLLMEMEMREKKTLFTKNSYKYVFQEAISGGKSKLITVNYSIVKYKNDVDIIKSVSISGNTELIIKLFISYWPTKVSSGEINKNEWVYCNLGEDRVGLMVSSKGNAFIEIKKK